MHNDYYQSITSDLHTFARLDGSGDGIIHDMLNGAQVTHDWTVEFWLRWPVIPSSSAHLMMKGGGNSNLRECNIRVLNSTSGQMFLYNANGAQILDLRFDHRVMTANKWHRFVATKKLRDMATGMGHDAAIIINGVTRGSNGNAGYSVHGDSATAKYMCVGYDFSGLIQYTQMDIRGIRWWDKALTEEELAISRNTRFIRNTAHASELGITASLKVNVPYKNYKVLDYTGNSSGSLVGDAKILLDR